MHFNIRPILSALVRSRAGAILVALQVALALAIMVNAAFVVHQRLTRITQPTGLDVTDQFAIFSTGFTSRFHLASSLSDDLAYLRGLGGVVAATASNTVPFNDFIWGTDVWTEPGQRGEEFAIRDLEVGEEGLQTLGARLIAGRNFRPDEIQNANTAGHMTDWFPEIIVTRALARVLSHGTDALGKTVYFENGKPAVIIGIATDMRVGTDRGDELALFPGRPGLHGVYYLVRSKPGMRDVIMRAAEEHLAASNPDRVIHWARSVESFKRSYDSKDRNMVVWLTLVTTVVVAVTCLGIFALASFNVSIRTKQIGTLRAVGARRADVIAHFLIESALVLAGGIALGSTLALAVGYWLSMEYHLPRLDIGYLLGGALILAAIGQLAAWHPARRAASVPPSVATRTV